MDLPLIYEKRPSKIGRWSGRKSPWKNWFAWRPVTLGLHGKTVWLRRVKRRFVTCRLITFSVPIPHNGIRWEYRL
jgi:hypothetical protein